MRTADFDYDLPPELIAQTPAPQRDQSRLLVLKRPDGRISHRHFRDFPSLLRRGDVLVLNDSRVIAARLRGTKTATGGQVELLLLEERATNDWWVMLRPAKRVRAGTHVRLQRNDGTPSAVQASVVEKNDEGHVRVRISGVDDILNTLDSLGEVPLPPYISRSEATSLRDDLVRYQTVYARPPGSVAAPTAGLHFTEDLLNQVRSAGVEVCFVTLHVGFGTFAPVKTDRIDEHIMHRERFELTAATAHRISTAQKTGGRVIAVGTTTARVLESIAAQNGGELEAGAGWTRIFIRPPYKFEIVDALLTNFHLPQSTLLMLVSAFAAPGGTQGRQIVLNAYAEAVRERYRFFSYGDAMFVS